MSSKFMIRFLSFALVLVTLMSYVPTTLAVDNEAELGPVTDVPVSEAETVPPTQAATEPSTEPTEADVQPAETQPVETQPVSEETENDGNNEAVPTFSFPGMPEGYVLSEEEYNAKMVLTSDGTAERILALTAGTDYIEGVVIFPCEDNTYAQLVADAYGAVLVSCEYGVATLQLQGCTVVQAVTAAADMSLALPAVCPDYMIDLPPVVAGDPGASSPSKFYLPERQSWETWVLENLYDPDPYISDPQAYNFQWQHDMVNSYEAWGVTTGNSNVVVAVIDTGVSSHSDIDDVFHVDIGQGTTDSDGHGTHVAGIIAATQDNGIGGSGIAPGVSIMNVKAGNNGFSYSSLAKAINAATNNGAWIINMSLGGPFPNSTVQYAINRALNSGVTLVAAMGNDGTNAVNYPAAYDGVIGVCAVDRTGNRAYFSTYGDWADVSAPGYDIISTTPGGYTFMSGTSQASPVVAGVCALYMSSVGYVTPAEMEKVLERSCNKAGSGMGAGIVDAAKLFDKVVNTPTVAVVSKNGYYSYPSSGCTVPADSSIDFFSNVSDHNDTLIYTINGRTPSVKNGKIVNGTEYYGPISLDPYVGSTITIRAAAVTGMGKISKVVTWKCKVVASNHVERIDIIAPNRLVAGKRITLGVEVQPSTTASKSVTWSIISRTGDTSGVKITSKGVLSTPSRKSGTVTVMAVSTADNNVYDIHTIRIETVKPVYTMKLNMSKTTVFVYNGVQLNVTTLADSSKNPISASDCGLQWSSSNKKIATVDANGYVSTHAKGKVTITCKALDGSGKSAKCTITVAQPVYWFDITGQAIIARGCSATYKATAYPSNASNKSVIWQLENAPYGVTISSSGKVKVASWVSDGSTFTVKAVAKDGDGAYGTFNVTVAPKCTAVYIDSAGYYGPNRFVYNSKGYVSSVNLFTTELSVDSSYSTTYAGLKAVTYGSDVPCTWSTSNSKVATVYDGYVYAEGKGTATITCRAQDGSGRKATVKVNVTVPVSQLTIKSNAPQMTNSYPCIAFGKSAKNSVVFGDTYGTPSNKKVTWSYEVFTVDQNLTVRGDYTDHVKSKKLVSLSSSGTLSISSKMKKELWGELPWGYDIVIKLTATAKDGTGVSDFKYFFAIPGATTVKTADSKKTYSYPVDTSGYYVVRIYSDQINYSANDMLYYFTATSSSPKTVSVYDIIPAEDYNGNRINNYYDVYLVVHKKGSAKITVKTADGTNKSCTFTVKGTY